MYLSNNKIEKIECMNHVPKLKLLYLQHNLIKVIDGLDDLTKLGNQTFVVFYLVLDQAKIIYTNKLQVTQCYNSIYFCSREVVSNWKSHRQIGRTIQKPEIASMYY